MSEIKQFYVKTPLVESKVLSELASKDGVKTNVYLKLDNIQPSGSFKLRGVGQLVLSEINKREVNELVIASGGNAGLAASYAAWKLNLPIQVIVPESTTQYTINLIKSFNANVIVHGHAWDEADLKAREICSNSPKSAYIAPFEDPAIWEGNATLIDEIKEELGDKIPDCIIASVGGGGLMNGIIEGLIKHNWLTNDIDIIAAETEGANCFELAIKNGNLFTMDRITSIAKTLGAKTVSKKLFEYYKEYSKNIKSIVVSDKEAVDACLKFLDDHKILTEYSCGASLAVAYNINKKIEKKYKNIVIIVCGGSLNSLEELVFYKKKFNLE